MQAEAASHDRPDASDTAAVWGSGCNPAVAPGRAAAWQMAVLSGRRGWVWRSCRGLSLKS
eukprot:SAG25_NODE_432_length_8108_cov_357.746442_7_plen_60_part_00